MDNLNNCLDVIAVTETKLNSESIDNVDIDNYNFFNDNSPTNAGGAGLYVNKNINVMQRSELKLNISAVESCWVELETGSNKPNIIIPFIGTRMLIYLSLHWNLKES